VKGTLSNSANVDSLRFPLLTGVITFFYLLSDSSFFANMEFSVLGVLAAASRFNVPWRYYCFI
jgi:hypothetical protein